MISLHLDNPAGADRRFNVGDDIQVQAALQFGPDTSRSIAKSDLKSYDGPLAKMVMNGWFMHDPGQWPPSAKIDPLMLSFHMNPAPAVEMLERGYDFFRRHAPIGCRDTQTLTLFRRAGIDAYFSGCLTLTLDRAQFTNPSAAQGQEVLAIDVLYKMRAHQRRGSRLGLGLFRGTGPADAHNLRVSELLSALLSESDLCRIVFLKNSIAIDTDNPEIRRKTAHEMLCRLANAKLVITSRIHAALPCLAFGTPVIFVDGGMDQPSERARLDSITNLMPVLPIAGDGTPDLGALELDLSPKLVAQRGQKIAQLRSDLIERCSAFWAQDREKC